MEIVLNVVSTRKVTLITEELCGAQFFKSVVSELCKNLEPLVEFWNPCPYTEPYPFVVVNAMVTYVCADGRARSRGMLLAFSFNMQGYRELLGF